MSSEGPRRVPSTLAGPPGSLVLPGLTDREADKLNRLIENARVDRASRLQIQFVPVPVDLLIALGDAIGGPILPKYRNDPDAQQSPTEAIEPQPKEA